MPRKKQFRGRGPKACVNIGEEVRISVKLELKKFLSDPSVTEYEFPSSLFAEERAYIHNLAKEYGLHSKSRGKNGVNRAVTVFKREGSSIVQADPLFTLCPASRHLIRTLLVECPITVKERQDLMPQLERDKERERSLNGEVKEINRAMGRLSSGVPQVPLASCNSEVLPFRQSLPIWNMQDKIVQTILNNQTVIIAGETGSGKTTQVPQFILEYSQRTETACRIVCTEPRRISAVSVSERVSTERNEKLGQSVGYQIRLESRVSPKTVLTYCTNGVLLRTLMGGDSILSTLTHVIVDEVHERDRFSDFLLIALKDALQKYRNLRLILMSATMEIGVFTKYFDNCPVITVPGRQYEVQEFFLEDVLRLTGFLSGRMPQLKKELDMQSKKRAIFLASNNTESKNLEKDLKTMQILDTEAPEDDEMKITLDTWMIDQMDKCIEDAWLHGSEDAFSQLLYFIHAENVPVDYQHSNTSASPLMVAAGRGNLEVTQQLLNLGADSSVVSSNNWTALDWALNCNQSETAEILKAHLEQQTPSAGGLPLNLQSRSQELEEEDRQLLEIYHYSFNDDEVDIKLCLALIYHLHSRPDKGAILVFLPGYDVITTLRDRINEESQKFLQSSKFMLYTLHSNMQTSDQKRVFQPAPANTRKIILSTNIAETSVTIDDVVYVIDSGKVKEKSFDAISGVSSLRNEWISQACAKQRKGRAGRTRPGFCYHMFSRVRHRSMQYHQTPEILRMPLQELCLHTKLLAPPNTAIADFLAKAMEPPPFMVTRNAVQLLKTIDALDPWEDLTELGHHLLDLPVEPRLGKMLLYAVVLKCLDPVLTIVCTLAYKDPFVLPLQPSLRNAARLARKTFAAGTFSDHMAMLRAFQAWQQSRSTGREASFCQKNFISSATMEQVMGLRAQLLGQLRASGFVRAKGGGDIRDLNSHAENWAVVKAALTAGFYPNIARLDKEVMQLRTMKESLVALHVSSTLRDHEFRDGKVNENLPTDWMVFEEMSRTGKLCQIRMCTVISPITVALFAGPMRLPSDSLSSPETLDGEGLNQYQSDSECEEHGDGKKSTLKLDDWINFSVDGEAAHLAFKLRQKWNATFLRRMRSPSKSWNPADDAVVQAVVQTLSSEEKRLGLLQPEGIGQRPRPVNIDIHSTGGASKRHEFEDTESVSSENSSHGQHYFRDLSRMNRKQDFGNGRSSSSIDDALQQRVFSFQRSETSQKGVRYFIIKAGSPKAIEISLKRSLWAFVLNTERKLLTAFKEGNLVMLIFSMQGSGSFQGVASLVSDHPEDHCPELAGPNIGSPFPIKWLKYGQISFQATRHLMNPFNENRCVQTSRDGQELEPTVALQLCGLWETHNNHNRSQFQEQFRNCETQPVNLSSQFYFQNQGGGRPIRGVQQSGPSNFTHSHSRRFTENQNGIFRNYQLPRN